MRPAFRQTIGGLVAGMVLLWAAAPLSATELYIPPLKATAGATVEVPLMLDAIDNLAGIKVVMTYDANLLTYKNAVKTDKTASLMHIVNDKKPGILIVVMAGPRGIQGKAFALLNLTFEVSGKLTGPRETTFNITEVQLMSDQLKDVKHTVKAHPLSIAPR